MQRKAVEVKVLLFCLCILSSSLPLFTYGQTVLSLARIEHLAEQEIAQWLLTDIYQQLGMTFQVTPLPGARAKELTRLGAYDGEVLRIHSYGENNPDILRVPTAYSSLETTAFALTKKNIVINTRDDLARYRIVVIRGVLHTQDISQGLDNVHIVENGEQMMNFLALGRADIALTNTLAGFQVLKRFGIKGIRNVGTIATQPLYHYLHRRNKGLIHHLDARIKKMIKSGELEKLRDKYEAQYIQKVELNRHPSLYPNHLKMQN